MENKNLKSTEVSTKRSVKEILESLFVIKTSGPSLQSVRTGPEGTIVVPLSDELEIADAHYLEDEDGKRYILCNGPGCLLCLAKNKKKPRYLLPVYEPLTKSIGVLPIGNSLTNEALLPLILPILENISDPPKESIFITRENFEYTAIKNELPPDVCQEVESVIRKFNAQEEKGEIDLKSIFSHYSNERMREIPFVANRLKMFGL